MNYWGLNNTLNTEKTSRRPHRRFSLRPASTKNNSRLPDHESRKLYRRQSPRPRSTLFIRYNRERITTIISSVSKDKTVIRIILYRPLGLDLEAGSPSQTCNGQFDLQTVMVGIHYIQHNVAYFGLFSVVFWLLVILFLYKYYHNIITNPYLIFIHLISGNFLVK